MARRVIATAEVQVAADVAQAEAGLEGLTETFRQIGSIAERAAAKAEAAFFQGATSISQAFSKAEDAVLDVVQRLDQGNANARHMAQTFLTVAANISKAQQEGLSLSVATQEMLNLLRQASASAGIFENNLEDAEGQARRLADEADLIAVATQSAAMRAQQLERAFRDVGQAIDVAMAGGLEQVEDDILDTIRRLKDMGGQFERVGRIGEDAFNDIVVESNRADASVEDVTRAVMRLARQLEGVEADELRRIERDAEQAAAAMNQMAVSAQRADRSIDGIGTVARRTSGDVRGLVGLLGAAGLGYAAKSAADFGLDMTKQLEKSEAAFLGLTGSVEGAADMLERMVIFARETPYNLANVTEAAAQLLAVGDGFGVTAQNVDKYLESFGNAITITGGSDDQFIRIVRVLGQMSSTGKVLGQDMNQLAQNLPGYDVWQALADGANTSVQELRRLQDLGQLDELLTGNEAVQILIEGMESIPGAAGAMERRMNTLGGAIEKFKETVQLSMSEGLEPFSETAQDALSDPVILRSVEGLADAFGALLSSGLEAAAPEFDDLAAAGDNLLGALQELAPAFAEVVDAVGDFMNFAAAIVGPLGKATSAVLGFGDGLGKMAVAAGLFAAGGPFGIAGGLLLGVSGAMDFFTGSTEDAANMARLLAAAQGEVNTAMLAGEEVVYSEAQQLAIDTANELRDTYGELFNTLQAYGLTVSDLYTGMDVLATGVGRVTPEFQTLLDVINNPNIDSKATGQFEAILEEYKKGTDVITEEANKQADALEVAGAAEIGTMEATLAALDAFTEQEAANWEQVAEIRRDAADAAAESGEAWYEADEERADKMRDLLQGMADDYADWKDEIDGSTQDVGLSLSTLADDMENDVDKMIQALNDNAVATFYWKTNVAKAATSVGESLGLSDEAAQEFMARLGELGPSFAPALAEMVDGTQEGKDKLAEFYNAVMLDSDNAATSVVDMYNEMSGAAPTLAESLADGTATVETVLAELPAAMEAAGLDMEAAADLIDLSDNMGTVGDEAVNGLVNALSSPANLARVRAASRALGNTVSSATSGVLRVQSPSRVFFEIGEFVVEGLVDGIQSKDPEAYAAAVQTASMLTGGIADHFEDAEDPQEEARKFAEDVAETIIEELLAEQEAVADAAEALAEAAADRLAEAWDRVKDRFLNRDIAEGIAEAQAELSEARAELAAAESLAGAGGSQALAAAEARVARAEAALAAAEAADTAADLIADQVLKDFQRATEDAVDALQKQQQAETAAIEARIATATRNLDPVARAAAEADLAAAKDRHEAEMTALERQREDEEELLRLRLDNENDIREAAIKAKEDELKAFEKALDSVVKSIEDAISDLPDLRAAIGDSERDLQDAYFKQFEQMLENASSVDRNLLASVGASAGLTSAEVTGLIDAALAAESAAAGAAAANLGVDQMLDILSSGLYTIGANGALGIAEGLTDGQRWIAYAMHESVQAAIDAALAALEISSPSRVTERLIGEPMAEGIAEGLMASEAAVSSAMAGLIDNVVGGVRVPSASQLVGGGVNGGSSVASTYTGPLVTMPGAVIQDATDADLVAQRVVVALSATGNY